MIGTPGLGCDKVAASVCVRIEEELGLRFAFTGGRRGGGCVQASNTFEALQQPLGFSRMLASFQVSCALSIWMPSLPSSDVTARGNGFCDEDGLGLPCCWVL